MKLGFSRASTELSKGPLTLPQGNQASFQVARAPWNSSKSCCRGIGGSHLKNEVGNSGLLSSCNRDLKGSYQVSTEVRPRLVFQAWNSTFPLKLDKGCQVSCQVEVGNLSPFSKRATGDSKLPSPVRILGFPLSQHRGIRPYLG